MKKKERKKKKCILSQFWRLEFWNVIWPHSTPSKALGGNLFLASSSLRWICIPRFVGTSLQSLPLLSYCLLLFPWSQIPLSLCLRRIPVTEFRTHPDNLRIKILSSITFATRGWSVFPQYSYVEGLIPSTTECSPI